MRDILRVSGCFEWLTLSYRMVVVWMGLALSRKVGVVLGVPTIEDAEVVVSLGCWR